MNIGAIRNELHELTLERLHRGDFTNAARDIRRLLLLPPAHEARRDLLVVLLYAERHRSEQPPSDV